MIARTKNRTVKGSFDEYINACFFGMDPRSTQYIELQRAFYAGWIDSLFVFTEHMARLSPAEAIANLEAMQKECLDFADKQIEDPATFGDA